MTESVAPSGSDGKTLTVMSDEIAAGKARALCPCGTDAVVETHLRAFGVSPETITDVKARGFSLFDLLSKVIQYGPTFVAALKMVLDFYKKPVAT